MQIFRSLGSTCRLRFSFFANDLGYAPAFVGAARAATAKLSDFGGLARLDPKKFDWIALGFQGL